MPESLGSKAFGGWKWFRVFVVDKGLRLKVEGLPCRPGV